MYPSLLNRFGYDLAFIMDSNASLLLSYATGEIKLAEHPYLKDLREMLKPEMTVKDGIAHIPIEGVLAYAPDALEMKYFGIEDSRNVVDMIQKARLDSAVKGAVLHINSPGGMMTGGFEMADAVAGMQSVKPVVAHVGGVGASMAYVVASQAGTVAANRTALVGSLGAFTVNVDRSRMLENAGIKVEVFKNKEGRYKAMGQQGTALTDDHRALLNDKSQAAFDEAKQMILSARPKVTAEAMQGQTFYGSRARSNGLVDHLCSADDATLMCMQKIKK